MVSRGVIFFAVTFSARLSTTALGMGMGNSDATDVSLPRYLTDEKETRRILFLGNYVISLDNPPRLIKFTQV